MESSRVWYGRELLAQAKKDDRIVALDADLSKSTMSMYVEEELPDRYFEVGIAEQNLLGISAGLALSGMKPFANTFAVFLTGRAYDQIRQVIAYPRLNVKIVGSSAGLSDYGDGATHQTIEDVSLMRTLPNMSVFVPADHIQTRAITRFLAEHEGPAYLRISRAETEAFFADDYQFRPGRVDRLLSGGDVTIVSCGNLLGNALQAAQELSNHGIVTGVLNVTTIKPFNRQDFLEALGDCKRVITYEEHNIIGGLGSTVAEVLAAEGGYRLHTLGVKDVFGQSALNYQELLEYYHLTVSDLVKAASELVQG
ncbi:transketolase [Hydrogenispora ethanolica]|uniref:Transketolase n=1 Tax=Hydrogenispora ethanolica TaxID=1082276 RepID=A0A4R1R811_HYDET|nr:transketolase C-terminal domain-containing protein [Hydrogenispora ethanolica]TCL61785.1 transketolase [Hydrogenispora ethanolica]